MAERKAVTENIRLAHVVTWSGLLNGDTGDAHELPHQVEKSAQAIGTFGTGGIVVLEGSNDGINWSTLTDHTGAVVSFGAAGLKQVAEVTRYVRAHVTAGDGSTNLTVVLLAR